MLPLQTIGLLFEQIPHFTLKVEAELKIASPVLKWVSNRSSCIDMKAAPLLNTWDRPT